MAISGIENDNPTFNLLIYKNKKLINCLFDDTVK